MNTKKICVVGLGYIGLPTATLFSNKGFQVYGVDKNSKIINALSKGEIHIDEPGLTEMAKNAIEQKSFLVSERQIKADIFIVCVPTPIKHESNNTPDLSYIEAAIVEMAPLLENGNLIVLESTSPVGTIEFIESKLIID